MFHYFSSFPAASFVIVRLVNVLFSSTVPGPDPGAASSADGHVRSTRHARNVDFSTRAAGRAHRGAAAAGTISKENAVES